MLVGLTLLAASHMVVLFIVGLFLVVVANTVSGTAYQGLVPDTCAGTSSAEWSPAIWA